jgi:succinoglycan biosynthesis transport protein ExoP
MKALTGSTSGFPVPVIEHRQSWLRGLVSILSRRRLVILRTTTALVAAGCLACVLVTHRYTATAEIQVQRPQTASIGTDAGAASDTSPDAGSQNLQTQATVLQSPALAMKVIEDLHLENARGFQGSAGVSAGLASSPGLRPLATMADRIAAIFSATAQKDKPGANLAESPARRDRLLKQFREDLDVAIVPGTRVIEVSFSSSDPSLSAQIVNHLVESLQDYSLQSGSTQTTQASKLLESQLADLKQQTDALQDKLVQLQKDTGVVQIAGDNVANGHAQVYSGTLDQLQKATDAVAQAHSNVVLKGTIYEMVKSGDPETIMGLSSGTALEGAPAGMSNSLATISNLRTRQATLKGQINEMLAKFGPAYPKVDELKADEATIETSIHEEIERLRTRAANEYIAAQQVETRARQLYDSEKDQASSMNDKAVQYELVRQQFEQSRDLYEKLQGQLKEANAMQVFRATNIDVVSAAFAPSSPSRPNVPVYLGGSLLAGLVLGCILAFLVDAMDNRIVDLRGLEESMGQAPFGILPSYGTNKRGLRLSGDRFLAPAADSIAALKEPHSAYVEALRALRTTLLSPHGGPPPQVLLVTSSTEGEGKSTLSANLAVVLAQQGKHVLLIDADLRRPNLHVLFNAPCEVGLSSVLGGKLPAAAIGAAVSHSDHVPGLDILVAGPVPFFSAELLGSSRMKQALDLWRATYDFVILDGAPVLPVTDSVVLSSHADATLLVARYESTERRSLDLSIRILRAQLGSNRRVGVVLNGVARGGEAYHTYYGVSNNIYSAQRLGGGNETL